MNLIDKFENAPFQDVGTFNSIFPWTPILGFETSTEVRIGKMATDSERLVFVNDSELRMSLVEPKRFTGRKKRILSPTKARIKREKGKARIKNTKPFQFSPIFKELTFGEYFIYSAMKEIGEVSSAEYFAISLRIDPKSVYVHMKNLINKGYVEATDVYKRIDRD